MPAKFEWYMDSYGKYRFAMKAGNGQVIARSDAYESKASCMHGIESIRKNARDAEILEVKGS
ncbi:MAG TPA: YegP family protein [Treponemataceae bacterium]|nr:YegP family protein [Treponemataceae bacterium]